MNHKRERLMACTEKFRGQKLNAHYLGYFECFNNQLFYEAHEVLEDLWLVDKSGFNGDFYKGLIQLTGAFVHLQKNRLRPAAALFKLATANLVKYPSPHEHLDLRVVLQMIANWHRQLEAGDFGVNPLAGDNSPQLLLDQTPSP